MGRDTGQWQCRVCGFDRWHVVSVKRKNGALYTTSFYACSGHSGRIAHRADRSPASRFALSNSYRTCMLGSMLAQNASLAPLHPWE